MMRFTGRRQFNNCAAKELTSGGDRFTMDRWDSPRHRGGEGGCRQVPLCIESCALRRRDTPSGAAHLPSPCRKPAADCRGESRGQPRNFPHQAAGVAIQRATEASVSRGTKTARVLSRC